MKYPIRLFGIVVVAVLMYMSIPIGVYTVEDVNIGYHNSSSLVFKEQTNVKFKENSKVVEALSNSLTQTPGIWHFPISFSRKGNTSIGMNANVGYSRFYGNQVHYGQDWFARFQGDRGTPESIVVSPVNGIIKASGMNSSMGNYVLMVSEDGNYYIYLMHMKQFLCDNSVNARLKQGQVVGIVGTTGSSTAPHLHYEVRLTNSSNPRKATVLNPMTLGATDLTVLNKKVDLTYNAKVKYMFGSNVDVVNIRDSQEVLNSDYFSKASNPQLRKDQIVPNANGYIPKIQVKGVNQGF